MSKPMRLLVAAAACAAAVALPALAQDKQPGGGLLDQADKIAARTAELRGLALKRPIKKGLMNRAQIEERLRTVIDEEYEPAALLAEERALKRLGLLPPAVDYKQLVIEVATEQVAGFYDPRRRELYIADWVSLGGDMAMAHEITHALQDQHFDLRAFMITVAKENRDAGAARQALVEGDATALMLEYVMAQTGQKTPWENEAMIAKIGEAMSNAGAMGGAKLGKAPRIIQVELIFPYDQGLRFAAHVRRHGPWRAIDAVYAKPPLSTEQILHPAKYDAYERPDEIAEKPLPSLKGTKVVYKNTVGELTWVTLLVEQGVPEARAKTAAAGWGGDRYVMYELPAGGGDVGVVYATWDDEADAIEVTDALGAVAGFTADTATGRLTRADADGKVTLVERKGDATLLVTGVPADRAAKIVADAWKLWKVKRR
jgi:hypothetical protein